MKCPTCNATGKFPLPTTVCPVCSGTGNLPDDRIDNPKCSVCGGSGKFPGFDTVCETCRGYGRLPGESRPLTAIYVEPGAYRTAHTRLEEVFKNLNGELRICDPYYGKGTLDSFLCQQRFFKPLP